MSTVDLNRWLEAEADVFRGSTTINVPEGWIVINASLRDASPFHCVVRVSYETPNGSDEKELFLRRPAPVVFAVRLGDLGYEVLLVRQNRHGAGCAVLELPGGMGKKGESDRDIAARELFEEGGISVRPDQLEHIGTVHRDVARSQGLVAKIFFVEVDPDLPTAAPIAEPGEHITGTHWALWETLQKETAAKMIIEGVLMAAIGVVSVRGLLN